MDKEQHVTYETAILLKEKGFDWQTEFVWYEHLPVSIDWRNKANQRALDYYYATETTEYNSSYRNCDTKPSYISGDIYSAPTQQMACRWLREEHKMFISIGVGTDIEDVFGYMPEIYFLEELDSDVGMYGPNVDSETICDFTPQNPEDAIEAALKFALTNLI